MVNPAEAWMTPEEIIASRAPDETFYTDWAVDPSFAPTPFSKQRATRTGAWGNALEWTEEKWERVTEIRYLREFWRIPAIRIPIIIESPKFVVEETGYTSAADASFVIRETQPQTVGRSTPEYRWVNRLIL